MNLTRKLIVFGGNGFLGKKICQRAAQLNWDVTSISRSGKIHDEQNYTNENWINKVNWVKGDIFKPDSYKDLLTDKTDVVHSMGILLENPSYKKWLNDPLSFFHSNNPLLDEKMSYDRWNTQSALILAQEFYSAIKSKNISHNDTKSTSVIPSFTYISSDHSFFGIPAGYINSKRKTEKLLQKYNDDYCRVIIQRPGFMFDENSHGIRNLLSDTFNLLNYPGKTLFNQKDILQPISTKKVSESVCDKIENNEFNGIVKLSDMI